MKRRLAVLVLVSIVLMPIASLAVSYPVPLYPHETRHAKYAKGEVLYLFHSGTADVRAAVHINDTLTVYRVSGDCKANPIGLIKVLALIGETHIRAEVIAGEIKPDDVAKKGNVSLLVISAGTCDN